MNIITINNNVMQKNISTRSKKKVYIKKKQKKKLTPHSQILSPKFR